MLRISACTAPFSEGGSCAPASATATQIAANELRIISAWMRPRNRWLVIFSFDARENGGRLSPDSVFFADFTQFFELFAEQSLFPNWELAPVFLASPRVVMLIINTGPRRSEERRVG